MSHESLYERILAEIGEPDTGQVLRPRSSAAVIPWRRSPAGELEVFWLRRADTLRFMGGWYAFPGGGLSRDDRDAPVAGTPSGLAGAPADGANPPASLAGFEPLAPLIEPGLVACALRELFEETGILPLAAADGVAGDGPAPEMLVAARHRLLAEERPFARLLAELGAFPDASRLVYAGRWLTPPLGPRHFDNRFFLLAWPRDRPVQPEVIPGEAAAGEWVRPAVAVERWRRGEILTAPPILHLLTVLAAEGAAPSGSDFGAVDGDGLERLRRPVETHLGPFRRIEFRPGILTFPQATPTLPPATHTNTMLVGTGEAVLIDPGSPFEAELERLLAGIEAARRELGRQVTAIWLTHQHPDHVGGVEETRRALGVPVLAHRNTRDMLAARGLTIDGELAEDEATRLEGPAPMTLRTLHTPGHAAGHLCFEVAEDGSLIAGDMVSGIGTVVVDPPDGNMDDYLLSLERLRARAPRTLLPAHGAPMPEGTRRLAEIVRHRRDRERRVLAAWRSGRRDPEAIVEAAYEELPPPVRLLAARQVAAHLESLERRGLLLNGA